MHQLFLLAIGIGIVAGLRSMTAPALVSWGAYLGWLNLHGSPLSFMGSLIAVIVFTLGAIGELIADKLPKTPARTAPVGLISTHHHGRIVRRVSLCGGGGIARSRGSVRDYRCAHRHLRRLPHPARAGNRLNVKDILIAIPEDIIAIVLAFVIVRSTLS